METTTTCIVCGYQLSEPDPGAACPRCAGPTHSVQYIAASDEARISLEEQAVVFAKMHSSDTAVIGVAHTITVISNSRYAGAWYEDALSEAQLPTNDYHARRRDILFAVCCAESYIYEWTADLLMHTGRPDPTVDRYFPPRPQSGWDRSVTDQWKEVPKLLHVDALLARRPELGGPHGDDWLTLVDYRNGLVHGLISRPEISGSESQAPVRPIVTSGDLYELPAGWAVGVVAERIGRLHSAAGTPTPPWLAER